MQLSLQMVVYEVEVYNVFCLQCKLIKTNSLSHDTKLTAYKEK